MAVLGYWPPVAHLALVAACAATAWWRIETLPVVPPRSPVPTDLAAPAPPASTGTEEADLRDLEGDVEAVVARALFRPGRLPLAGGTATEAGAEAAAPSPDSVTPIDLPALRMVGYVEQGGRRSVILQTLDDGQTQILQEGDEIAGARVRRISPGAVVIESADQEVTVELYPD